MEATAQRNTAPPEREAVFFGYVGVVCLAALVTLVALGDGLLGFLRSAPSTFWLMAVLAVLADARPLATLGRRQVGLIYPSICFSFAIQLSWGFAPAVLVQASAVVLSSALLRHRVWRAGFNIGQYVIAFAASTAVLRFAGPAIFAPGGRPGIVDALIALSAAAAWFVVSFSLVVGLIHLRFGGSLTGLVGRTLPYEALSTGSLLLLSPVLVAAAHISGALIPFVLIPLYAVWRMARLARQNEWLASQDPLTQLANRKVLAAEVDEQLATYGEFVLPGGPGSKPVLTAPTTQAGSAATPADPQPAWRLALLLLDIDRFKNVNDALGHDVGDRLLVEIGSRLRSAVGATDLVARLGGDEFAVVSPGIADVGSARRLAVRLAAVLAEPVNLDGLPLDVSGSIGVAVFPDHGHDFATLMRHADVAMYEAKGRGDGIAVYASESDHNSPERLSLLADLRRVLETRDEGLTFYYQPQVELSSGEVVGVEALLRWQHPTRGPVNPEELIRVAEHSAVMRPLTLRVVDDVVHQLAKWQAEGLTLRAAINVSVRDLHTGEIVDRLADRLRHHGVSPDNVQLEITEGALMADPNRVLATLRRLERLGVALSLDDFGTGYSSMQHLRRLPLSEVKIDRSFVLGMTSDPDDEAIVRSIVNLAEALGLRVVAEGVENEGTWRLLADAGCHAAQGWYYARPMPADELSSWLSRYRPPQQQLPGWPTLDAPDGAIAGRVDGARARGSGGAGRAGRRSG
jgi:diguanylate cyclase (GGDEF)-like protein